MDQLPVQVALRIFAANHDLDVIPAVGFNVARFAVDGAAIFNRVLRVAPAAEIPPHAVFIPGDMEQNQEPFRAMKLPRLQGESVIRPTAVTRERAHKFLLGIFLQGSVGHGPFAVPEFFPALGIF